MLESVFIALNIKRQQTPEDFNMTRSPLSPLALSTLLLLSAGTPAQAQAQAQAKAFTWTTQSDEAKKLLKEMQLRVESFQGGPQSAELARKIVAADPNFAMGVYYLSVTAPTPAEAEKIYSQARDLAKKASDGERRFIEAMSHARLNQGANFARSIPLLEALAADYPGERLPPVLLGQLYNNDNKPAQALAWFKKAQAIGTSPRIEAFIANDDLLKGNYAQARAKFEAAEKQLPKGAVPFPIRFGITFSHLYEGDTDAAIKSLETYLNEYKAGGLTQQFPEVFIWNSIARINQAKMVNIICDTPEPICDFILKELNKGATFFPAKGAFSHLDRYVIMSVMKNRQEIKLRRFLREHQPSAFVWVSHSSNIFGKGFLKF